MISFLVLSAPRSASTWASNWLTTERHLCLHDPILEHHIDDLPVLPLPRKYGIACTALGLLPDWCAAQRCPKLIVHRDRGEVDASLEHIGLTRLPAHWDGLLESIEGWHVHYQDLFRPGTARAIWEHLCGPDDPFDASRHALLAAMHIDPHFPRVRIDPERARDFRSQIERAFA